MPAKARAQSAPALKKPLLDRGFGRTPLPKLAELPPPTKLHLAAGAQFDREEEKMNSMQELLGVGPPAAEPTAEEIAAEEAAAAKAAEEAAAAEAAAKAERPGSGKGKKKSPAEQKAEEEAAAAEAEAAAAAAEEAAAAEAARLAAEEAARTNWIEHLEDRCAPYEWTPLMFAARSGSVEDLELLLELGADVHVRDTYGATPLHKAACAGGKKAVAKIQALVAAGAALEATDRYGCTPLHVAASNERLECIKTLIKLGASQFSKDGPLLDGDTPYQMAISAGLWEVAEVLKVSEVRRKKLTAGATRTVPSDTPYWSPPAFSAKRMSVKGAWGVAAGA